MVNEDIVTSLKNAVEHGERLEDAIVVLVNSGYSAAEVGEASKFVSAMGFGALGNLSVPAENHLVMPDEKGILKKMMNRPVQNVNTQPTSFPPAGPLQKPGPNPDPWQNPQVFTKPISNSELSDKIKKEIAPDNPYNNISPEYNHNGNNNGSLSQQLSAISPPAQSNWAKEIILLVVLLVLVGVLIMTITFKDKILTMF